MEYINFEKRNDRQYVIYNNKNEKLGLLEYIKVGQWMSWCLTAVPDVDVYFSASCLDTVRNKIKELNGKRFKS